MSSTAKIIIAVLAAAASIAVAFVFLDFPSNREEALAIHDFATDPLAGGWTKQGEPSSWNDDGENRFLHLSQGGWSLQTDEVKPLAYYRIDYRFRSAGQERIRSASGIGSWSVHFLLGENEQVLEHDVYDALLPSDSWTSRSTVVRTPALAESEAEMALRLKLAFSTPSLSGADIDDVRIHEIDKPAVARWHAEVYDSLPAKPEYQPAPERWNYLPETRRRLQNGGPLRILLLGDSIVQDLGNSLFEASLQSSYPNSEIEVICSTKGGTGMGDFKNQMERYVFRYHPDLVVLGGISNGRNYVDNFRAVLRSIAAQNESTEKQIEAIVLSKGWSPSNHPNPAYYYFSPSMTELIQDRATATQSRGYRHDLLSLCQELEVAFLDMTGILSQFVYGPAKAAGYGPPANEGSPYDYWMRDYIHANYRAKHVSGRVLANYLSP